MHIPEGLLVTYYVLCNLHLALYGYIVGLYQLLLPRRFRKRKDISGQIVLITGAGSGIGRQLAIEFSRHAVTLVLLDLKTASILETEKLLQSNTRTLAFECDVSDRQQVYKVAKEVAKQVGKVDILVNNAGIVSGKRFLDLPDEMIVKTMEVNALAHFWTCKAFLPAMLEGGRGHVVCVSSAAGLQGLPLLTDYCASKFAVVGLMESLRMEMDGAGTRALKTTTVCPNLTGTGLFQGSRPALCALMEPEYVAREIVSGVLAEEEIILLPRWQYLILLLKLLMPDIAVKAFYKKSGLLEFMDEFTGRENVPAKEEANGHVNPASINNID